jgi:hypothetical protein
MAKPVTISDDATRASIVQNLFAEVRQACGPKTDVPAVEAAANRLAEQLIHMALLAATALPPRPHYVGKARSDREVLRGLRQLAKCIAILEAYSWTTRDRLADAGVRLPEELMRLRRFCAELGAAVAPPASPEPPAATDDVEPISSALSLPLPLWVIAHLYGSVPDKITVEDTFTMGAEMTEAALKKDPDHPNPNGARWVCSPKSPPPKPSSGRRVKQPEQAMASLVIKFLVQSKAYELARLESLVTKIFKKLHMKGSSRAAVRAARRQLDSNPFGKMGLNPESETAVSTP